MSLSSLYIIIGALVFDARTQAIGTIIFVFDIVRLAIDIDVVISVAEASAGSIMRRVMEGVATTLASVRTKIEFGNCKLGKALLIAKVKFLNEKQKKVFDNSRIMRTFAALYAVNQS